MRYGYYSGMSYDEYLAHWGIVGMKWGQRRYQNPDGTLTPAGRERYSKGGSSSSSRLKNGARIAGQALAKGAMAAGKVGAKAAGRVGEGIARGVKSKLAEKMPFMLNDEELARYRERLNLENTYRQSMANRRDLKKKADGDQFVKNLAKDVISTSAKTVANKAVNKWIDEKLKDDDDRRKEELALQVLEYNVSKNKAESAANELKADMNNDVNAQSKDKNKERKLNRDISDAANSVQKANDDIADYDRTHPDPTMDPAYANVILEPWQLNSIRERYKSERAGLVKTRDKAEAHKRELDKELSDLKIAMKDREDSLKERRSYYDTILNTAKINSIEDFLSTFGKDKTKRQRAIEDFLATASDEERAIAEAFLQNLANNQSP